MHPEISAVIVTYHCGPGISETLSALRGQVGQVFIVDNGSDAPTREALAALQSPGCHLILNDTNLGLAAAQNQGIARALEAGAEWVLLLDHDSIPQPGMVEAMLAAWRAASDPSIGIIVPLLVERNVDIAARYAVPGGMLGFRRVRASAGETRNDIVMAIASGSLIHAPLLRAVGIMRGDFFIDNVDFEFCLRAQRAGYRIMLAGDARLSHAQGDKTRSLCLVTANYNPQRRYYIFRNRLWLLRLHGARFPFLLPHEILACFYDLLRIVLLEKQKAAKLAQALRGLWDGVFTKPSSPIS